MSVKRQNSIILYLFVSFFAEISLELILEENSLKQITSFSQEKRNNEI